MTESEVRSDVRGTPTYEAVAEHVRRWHEPGFGRPHLLAEPHGTADGSRLVVTGSVLDELAGRPRTALYTVRDGELAALTTGGGSARWGRFAPDGRRLAFLSDRAEAGVFQLYLLEDTRLGEATATPAVPGTVEYAHWSPDGSSILLGVAGLGAELAGTQGSGAHVRGGNELPEWHPVVEVAGSESAWRTLWLYTLGETVDTGELRRLSPEGMNCWESAWCGDDQVIAVSSDSASEDSWYDAVLSVLDLATGESRVLVRSDVQFGWPAGSPDGRYAAVVQAVCSDRMLVAGDLTVIDVASGNQIAVDTAGADVTWLQWLDGERLGYLGQRRWQTVAGTVAVPSGTAAELFATEVSCGGGRYPDGFFTDDGRVLVVQTAYDVPPQVAVLSGEHSGEKDEVLASTAHPGTDYLLSVAGTAEAVTWTAPDGLEIEGLLCRPAGDGPFPLVLNVHGGPVSIFRSTWSMSQNWVPLLVSRGYAVLCPNPRGSGGRGQEFAARVVGDMGGADTYDYLSGIDALVARGVADPARLAVMGGSYGGFMTSWLVTQDQRFAAAVPMVPVTDWYSFSFTSNIGGWGPAFLTADPEEPGTQAHTRSPVLHASKVRTPCLNIAGAVDRCTPPEQAREFHQALLSHGHAESVLVTYPGEGHGVRSHPAITDLLTRILRWYDHHLA